MKLAIAGLCFLGLIAAACAAVLVNGLRISPVATAPTGAATPDANPEVRVLYATRNAPSMTVIDGAMVTTRVVKKSEAPEGFISDPVEVVGRVAAQQLVAGQPFIKSSFSDANHPKQIAAIIPPGKRAVTISVGDHGSLDGLLFPGCMVDVMVSFKPSDQGTKWREALTTTLLENIQILALDQQTVLSPGKMLDDVGGRNANRRVTLLVDTKQAKALSLAMDQGTLSLALRNPLDGSETDKEIVSVHSLIGDVPPIALHEAPVEGLNLSNPLQAALAALAARDYGMRDQQNNNNQNSATAQAQPAKAPEAPKAPHWDVTVIHGGAEQTQSFPMPNGKVAMGDQGTK